MAESRHQVWLGEKRLMVIAITPNTANGLMVINHTTLLSCTSLLQMSNKLEKGKQSKVDRASKADLFL